MKITSVSNELIKNTAKLLQKKYRDELGLFLLEGEKCVAEAIDSGVEIIHIFELENEHKFANSIEVNEAVISKISSTSTSPKVVAVGKKVIQVYKKEYKKVVLLEDIKDAGNLGTILRSASAFNVDAIVLYGDTVDLYNPKTVRSAVGNLWKVPVIQIKDISILTDLFDNYEKIATLPKSDDTIWLSDYKPNDKTLVMFGTESSGLSLDLKNIATKNVTIEMNDKVESLNLSISAGVFMYEAFGK